MFEFIRIHQMDIMLFLCASCLTIAFLLFLTSFISKRRKRILIFMEFVAAFLLYFDRMAYIYSGDASDLGFIMVRVSNFFVFFLTSAIVFGFNMYLKDLFSAEFIEVRIPKRLEFVRYASVCGMLLVVISQFTGLFYYFDESNQYHRGPGFLISYIIPVVCPLIQYTVLRQYKEKFSRMIYRSLVLYIFVPILVGVVQIFTYGISIVNMSMVLVSISLYVYTYLDINETVKKAHKHEMKELKDEKKSMKKLFEETALAFVHAAEKKDPSLKDYPETAAYYAGKLAERVGKNKDERDKVYYAALLHCAGIVDIPEYPYLKEATEYVDENYDGNGNEKGLKGGDIPEAARIIRIAEDHVSMTTLRDGREPLPYPTIREEYIKQAGAKYDPELCLIMINIMDIESTKKAEEEEVEAEKELLSEGYRGSISKGIPVTEDISEICFNMEPYGAKEGAFHESALIIFDSYDRKVHDNAEDIADFHYLEYGEVWFDGRFVSTAARNIVAGSDESVDYGDFPPDLKGYDYRVKALRYEDRMKLFLSGVKGNHSVILALPDSSKASYIGITGENCRIKDIEVRHNGRKAGKDDIQRIVEEESSIERMESDLPNIQIDRFRSASTEGIRIDDDLRIDFHFMSLPGASLIWHCPFLVLFYSEDGRIDGKGYREYALIKFNGEVSNDANLADNDFSMKKNERFPGWDVWKEKNKEGLECTVLLSRKGNAVTMSTENLGVEIKNKTIIHEMQGEIYASLTGDETALTDIRIR